MTKDEDAALVKYFAAVRPEGASLDRETLQVLAQEVIHKSWGGSEGELQNIYFDDTWARDSKRRKGWTWRGCDTDRRP